MKTIVLTSLLGACALVGAQPSTLDDALRGSSSRSAVEAAKLRLASAKQSRRALAAFPGMRLALGYTSDPEVGGSDDDLVLTQPLDIFGRTAASRRSGDALVAQAEAELKQVLVDVQAEVIEAYLTAASASEMARVALAAQDTLRRLHDAIAKRVEEGVAPGVQLTRVSIDLDQAKLRTEQRETELRASLKRLGSLMGKKDVTIPSGFPDLSILPYNAEPHHRPDVQLLAANVQAAEAEAQAARLNGMPELEVQGRKSPWQAGEDRFGVRVQLNIPLFDNGRVRAEAKAANTKAEAARKTMADATKIAQGEIDAAKAELETAKDQVRRYEKIVETAQSLVERLRPALTEQATTLIEVLDATRALRDVEESLVEARERFAQAQARFLKATGRLLGDLK